MSKNNKRDAGEGSFGLRANGTHYAKILANGKVQWLYGKTKAEVRDKLDELRKRRREGAPLKDYSGTVAAWLDEWLATYKEGKCEQTTFAWYARMIRVHLKPAFGTLPLKALTAPMVQRWVNQLEKSKSSATVHHAYKVLHMAMSTAHALDTIRRCPTEPKLLKLAPLVNKEVPLMDEDEQRKFFDRANRTPHSLYFNLVATMALRRGEALGLKWSDFDESKNLINIRRSLARVFYSKTDSRLELKATKTERSARELELPAPLALRLKQHHKHQLEVKLKKRVKWEENLKANPDFADLIFTTRTGLPLEPRNCERAFKKILKQAGLNPHFRLHGLRHTAATEMLEDGEDLKTISEFLGHSSVAITDKIYTKVRATKLAAASATRAARMARVAGGVR